MKSSKRGKGISKAEILHISQFGIWMLVLGREYFLNYEEFPWFKSATIEQVYDFEFIHGRHLYWKSLDIDLSIASLEEPAKFPLKARV
jgi:hypothetical protein